MGSDEGPLLDCIVVHGEEREGVGEGQGERGGEIVLEMKGVVSTLA